MAMSQSTLAAATINGRAVWWTFVATLSLTTVSTPAGAQTSASTASVSEAHASPPDTKYAFVNISRVAAESAGGKTFAARVAALNERKINELNEKTKTLQIAQQKADVAASVMNRDALAQLQKEIERQHLDIQRFTEDAQAEVQDLEAQLQAEFERRLSPILQQIAIARGLHLLFSVGDSGLVWADSSLDITAEVIQTFDAAPERTPVP